MPSMPSYTREQGDDESQDAKTRNMNPFDCLANEKEECENTHKT